MPHLLVELLETRRSACATLALLTRERQGSFQGAGETLCARTRDVPDAAYAASHAANARGCRTSAQVAMCQKAVRVRPIDPPAPHFFRSRSRSMSLPSVLDVEVCRRERHVALRCLPRASRHATAPFGRLL